MERARTLEGDGHKYKFFWTGCKEGSSGVGILVAAKWLEKVVEVKRINERLMMVILTDCWREGSKYSVGICATSRKAIR